MARDSKDDIKSLLAGIQEYIYSIESRMNKFVRQKQRLKKTALRLINLIIKKFEQYSKQDYTYTRTFEDPEVLNAIATYIEERDTYRKELFEAVDNTFKNNIHYKSLDNHKIKQAIMQGNDVTTIGDSAASINPIHRVYIFLYKDIHSFKDSADAPGEVAGFATNGDGFCHIFNLALINNPQREELIAHEVGHAFGLEHTFDKYHDEKEITKEYQDRLKQVKEQSSPTEVPYDALLRKFRLIKGEIDNNIIFSNLDYEILDRTFDFWKKNESFYNNQQRQQQVNNKILETDYNKKLENTLNLKQGQTKENYLDYDIPKRKSFWYWQWVEMRKNVKLLEENKL